MYFSDFIPVARILEIMRRRVELDLFKTDGRFVENTARGSNVLCFSVETRKRFSFFLTDRLMLLSRTFCRRVENLPRNSSRK